MPNGDAGHGVALMPMVAADVPQVHAIEIDCFPSPWPRKAFVSALGSRWTRFFTAVSDGRIVGYGGIRLGDSAHILNIAVHRDYRRRGIGSDLLRLLVELAAGHEASRVTLEVRASNEIAQTMYRKFGFGPVDVKKGYYRREKEDAVVMAKEIAEEGGNLP